MQSCCFGNKRRGRIDDLAIRVAPFGGVKAPPHASVPAAAAVMECSMERSMERSIETPRGASMHDASGAVADGRMGARFARVQRVVREVIGMLGFRIGRILCQKSKTTPQKWR